MSDWQKVYVWLLVRVLAALRWLGLAPPLAVRARAAAPDLSGRQFRAHLKSLRTAHRARARDAATLLGYEPTRNGVLARFAPLVRRRRCA